MWTGRLLVSIMKLKIEFYVVDKYKVHKFANRHPFTSEYDIAKASEGDLKKETLNR